MDAKSLMIGDWVRNKKTGNIFQWSSEDYTESITENIDPIPLTEEILKVNGFVFDSEEYEYQLKGFPSVLTDYYSLCIYWQGHLLRFYFVHQLQHALRLCRLNDLADNFKIE